LLTDWYFDKVDSGRSILISKRATAMSSLDPVTLKYLNLAVELEQNTNSFYETARDKVKDPDLKSVLNSMMESETGHLESITRVRDLYAAKLTMRVRAVAAMRKVHKPKTPFRDMTQINKLTEPEADLGDIITEAAALEQKAHDFYMEAAEHADGDFIKEYLTKLAEEELLHKEAIESIRAQWPVV